MCLFSSSSFLLPISPPLSLRQETMLVPGVPLGTLPHEHLNEARVRMCYYIRSPYSRDNLSEPLINLTYIDRMYMETRASFNLRLFDSDGKNVLV